MSLPPHLVVQAPNDPGQDVDEGRRRSHRKSRAGCSECKRRRIKCDEVFPICGHCRKSGRSCPFSSRVASPNVGTPPSQDPPATRSELPMPMSEPGAANMMQLKLLNHFLSEESALPFRSSNVAGPICCSALVAMGEECEYLMTEILAFSARHMALQQPARKAFYMEHAAIFHARAISLFSATHVDLESTRILNIVFFSWLVGTYLLSDMALADSQQISMVSRFLQYADVYRGVRTTTMAAWHQLGKSEDRKILGAFLSQGIASMAREGRGTETLRVRSLISNSLGLSQEVKNSHVRALDLIQSVIDVKLHENSQESGQDICMHMCFAWPLIVDQELFDLAKQHRPESLLVLAFFAVMLYWCEGFWMFGHTGRLLLESISASIGPGWEQWLQWPMSRVGNADIGLPTPHTLSDDLSHDAPVV